MYRHREKTPHQTESNKSVDKRLAHRFDEVPRDLHHQRPEQLHTQRMPRRRQSRDAIDEKTEEYNLQQ
jgi:hypothetical protein